RRPADEAGSDPAASELPPALSPHKSMSERRAAVCPSKARLASQAGLGQGFSPALSLKGTARVPQCRRAALSNGSAVISLFSSDFAVEVQVGFADQAHELVLIPDLDAHAREGIQTQLDFEGAQVQGHFI